MGDELAAAAKSEIMKGASKAAAAAKSEIMKGDKLGRQGGSGSGSGSQRRNHEAADKPAEAAKSEIMKGDKLGRQGSSGTQKRNHEGRQASQTRRQWQPRAKS